MIIRKMIPDHHWDRMSHPYYMGDKILDRDITEVAYQKLVEFTVNYASDMGLELHWSSDRNTVYTLDDQGVVIHLIEVDVVEEDTMNIWAEVFQKLNLIKDMRDEFINVLAYQKLMEKVYGLD